MLHSDRRLGGGTAEKIIKGHLELNVGNSTSGTPRRERSVWNRVASPAPPGLREPTSRVQELPEPGPLRSGP